MLSLMHPWIRHALGLLLASFFLWLSMRDVDLAQLGSSLASVSYPLFCLGGLLSLAVSAVHCTKIIILMAGIRRIRFLSTFSAELVSILVDIVLPMRLQELVRAFIIGRSEGLPASRILGVQVVEKAVELPLLLGLLLLLGSTRPLPAWAMSTVYAGLGSVTLVMLVLGFVIAWPTVFERPIRWFGRLGFPGARPVSALMFEVLTGMRQASTSVGRFVAIVMITMVEWALLAGALWLAVAAIGVHLSPGELLGLLVASFVAFAVPSSTTAALGIYEFTGKTMLMMLFGMAAEQALAVVVVAHATLVGFGILGGLAGVVLANVSISEVRQGVGEVQREHENGDEEPQVKSDESGGI